MLVGLDWAEPMMHLNFACHMFTHFHAYIPYYFYLLILNMFGAFLIASLSLSLSLTYISCILAPKRKPIPSRNPLRSRASSSSSPSDPTPSHIQFRDEKAKSDFLENFSQRGIHLEHQVILSDFSDTNLPTVIYSRGWESLCGIPVMCPSVIIQEFYSNMHRFDYSIPFFFTRIQGVRMVVTPDIVSEVLHVPKVTNPDYPGSEHLRTMSKDKLTSLFCETLSS